MTDEEFVEIWNSSSSIEEVKRRTGLSGARQKASILRGIGFTLALRKSKGKELYKDNLDFVQVWNASITLDEVAQKLSEKKSAVSSKATKLRGIGISLKKMPKSKGEVTNDAEFVFMWNSAATLSDVERKTGFKKASLTNRAVKLRRAGYSLKKFRAWHAGKHQ